MKDKKIRISGIDVSGVATNASGHIVIKDAYGIDHWFTRQEYGSFTTDILTRDHIYVYKRWGISTYRPEDRKN